MKTLPALLTLFLGIHVCLFAQEKMEETTFRSHISFEYGGQIPLADMRDRFGSDFNLGSQVEILHTSNHLLAGVKAYYMFGNVVKEDVLEILRSPEGWVIGNDGGPASIVLRERGFFVGPYVGKLWAINSVNHHSGIKLQLGAGLLQHNVRIQDDSRTVTQLADDYKKGYDRLSNGLAGYLFLGYQHLDYNKRINFLAGFDVTYGKTQSRRDFDFTLMRKDDTERTDALVGFRIGWILPITTGVPPEKIYY